ncbi:MAG: permease [Spirochaetales bacterium]|nr:permease [Spirochaetales bacterium]
MGFIVFVLLLTAVLYFRDREKTLKGLKIGGKKFLKIMPVFLVMLVFIAVALTLLPQNMISEQLSGSSSYLGVLFGLVLGSIAVMPGFVAFPLGSVLRDQGVQYMVIAAFTSSLMMVGILTFPVERQFFGTRFALLRNIASALISLLIALVMGLVFGEIL